MSNVKFPDSWEWSKLDSGHYLVEGFDIIRVSSHSWKITYPNGSTCFRHSLRDCVNVIKYLNKRAYLQRIYERIRDGCVY